MEPHPPHRPLARKKWTTCIGFIISGLGVGLIQIKIYFVRELLVAELLLLLAFALCTGFGILCYFLGTVAGHGRLLVRQGEALASIRAPVANSPNRHLRDLASLPHSSD